MADNADKNPKKPAVLKDSGALLIDEFEIIELEDRLELAGRCNGRCDKQKDAT